MIASPACSSWSPSSPAALRGALHGAALIWLLAHAVYRTRSGRRADLERGGALLVANHVSFVDAVLIAAVAGRPVRFLMFRGFFGVLLGWFARRMDAIPVSSGDSKEEKEAALGKAVEAARAGELVCIFAEGRSPGRPPCRSGPGSSASADARIPVLPVALDRLWGSIFSYSGGRAFKKLPGVPLQGRSRSASPLLGRGRVHRPSADPGADACSDGTAGRGVPRMALPARGP